jgi:Tfp pilus assembly protein PilX
MLKRRRIREGVALVTALIFLAVVVVFVSTALLVSTSNRKLSGNNLRTYQAQFAAEAGLQRVIAESWFIPYKESEHEDVPEDYRVTLEGTATNPLIIEGTVYVNGDIALHGAITGDEKIVARDNVYINGTISQ